IETLGNAAAKRLAGFRNLLERMQAAARETSDAAGAVDAMLRHTGLIEAWLADGSDEGETRAENLRELLGAAQDFDLDRVSQAVADEARGLQPPEGAGAPLDLELPPLQAFLERISLAGEVDGEVGEGRASLMTMHAAKGLEFDAVFLSGMEEGVFPHNRTLGEDADPAELEEERRLCYVGLTRARKHLFLSFAQARSLFGELRFNPPSRFLRDIPKELFGGGPDPQAVPTRPAMPPRMRRARDEVDPYSQVPRRSNAPKDGIHIEYEPQEGEIRGMRVRHAQFGEGIIEDADGVGPNAKVTVRFASVGLKRIVARFVEPV
ncbi:MAG TPA: 3'-5' exonuclease, partial [Myxococcaceae bacterium]|nr:3'-5' exonuclease [Myxococcaceae bacterium]